jgi:ribosome maturation factor RimP
MANFALLLRLFCIKALVIFYRKCYNHYRNLMVTTRGVGRYPLFSIIWKKVRGVTVKKEEVEVFIAGIMPQVLEGTGISLVDVEYVREKEWYLRIFIDKPEGVEIDDCQLVSEKLTTLLDAKDPIKEKYYLEVSSPGIDRPLKKETDFLSHYGSKIDINFYAAYEGEKLWTAVLVSHDKDSVLVKKISKGIESKTAVKVSRSLIADIRPHLEF